MRRIPEYQPATLHTVTLLFELLQTRGHDAAQILQGSGLTVSALAVPNAMVTQAQELRVCANALALTGDMQLGLRLGARMHILTYGLLGYTMMVSPTLGDALEVALKYESLVGSWSRITLRIEGRYAVLAANGYEYRPDLRDFAIDLCIASLAVVLRDLNGEAPALLELRLRRAGGPRDEKAVPLGCPVRFAQAEDALYFDRRWLGRALPLADSTSHRAALHDCHLIAERFAQQNLLLRKVREWLEREVEQRPTLSALAQSFNLSPRTMRRRIDDAGSSYHSLLDNVRHDAAIRLLEQTQSPIAHIAEQLGYAESASFRHAFRRWTSLPPSAYRR